ncbi:MAG: ATP-binding protein [Opitutaceae bacterium]|jgi:PAS domain S-box-containing protein
MPETLPPSASSPHDRERLFDLSLDLLCIAGLDGYFKHVNPSWTRVLGWSREELLARPVADFIHPDDRERTLSARTGLAQGKPVLDFENRYLCKDGSHRWLCWQSSIEPGGTTVFAVARDITERRQHDHDRMVLSKLESIGILAGGLAHDFNNLLAGLQLNSDLLALGDNLTSRQTQLILQNHQIIQSAQQLTQKLLAFGSGGLTERKPTDLKHLLKESLELALSGSNVRSECLIDPNLCSCHVDETQIGQVVSNLVLNAREAMPSGGTVYLKAENASLGNSDGVASSLNGYVRVTIRDDGPGITREVLPKVFDPYFSTKRRGPQKGMGLGLTISHTIIQKNGGALTVDSTPGRGTTVCFLLPAVSVPVVPTVPSTTVTSLAGKRILVMDDEAPLLEIISATLKHLGYVVVSALTGEQAVALFTRARDSGSPFSAVLLDLTVRGGMGGAEAIKQIRELDPSVRAVLMTGYDTEHTTNDYRQHGFMRALTKPFNIELLRSTMSEVIGSEV